MRAIYGFSLHLAVCGLPVALRFRFSAALCLSDSALPSVQLFRASVARRPSLLLPFVSLDSTSLCAQLLSVCDVPSARLFVEQLVCRPLLSASRGEILLVARDHAGFFSLSALHLA